VSRNSDKLDRTNLIIILGMMQVSKRIPFEDPQVLMLVRGAYLLSNVIIVAIYAYTHLQINKKKGMIFSVTLAVLQAFSTNADASLQT
jgi:hypothetical protein